MRGGTVRAGLLVVLLLGALAAPAGVASAAGPALLSQSVARYPRVIRLAHSGAADGRVLASVATYRGQASLGAVFESTDDGASFQQVGTVDDPAGGSAGLCCLHLFELPQQVGDLPAGTLLWTGNFGHSPGPDGRMSLRIWRSADVGRTWSYLSTCAESPNRGELWEPELSVDAAGRLVCHFSDESEGPAHSQTLARTVSTDGVHWSGKTDTVVSGDPELRPGMAMVRRLPDGDYYMTYELCAQHGQYFCAAYFRVSKDGWDWGDPADLGALVRSVNGRYFIHAPTIETTRGGRLVLIGQVLLDADGAVAKGNGTTLFVNDANGRGDWTESTAPVSVPEAADDRCPNYSPSLLPSADGRRVLEISTNYSGDNVCRAYFATGSLPNNPG
ncbi:exo-alpha-sialidase [Solihabitans fulvus]|uniref:Exo-alpha-sialidase n=1 Tax=Solihabitans fulvus TaxID=1892852 RepID=A0A5B2WT22_9PSEU|nr:sialidase family protein [Solihabitans fulvus]KAA2253559.1 exo-alpha-sialidase [Solihabitans fulvus]